MALIPVNVPNVPNVPNARCWRASVVAVEQWQRSAVRELAMSIVIRQRKEQRLADGVYRAVIADIEPGIASRFGPRDDLVRVSLDVIGSTETPTPRLWLIAAPTFLGRLQTLIEAALQRGLNDDEVEGFDLEELLGKEVQVVVAQMMMPSGFLSSRIVTFLPVKTESV